MSAFRWYLPLDPHAQLRFGSIVIIGLWLTAKMVMLLNRSKAINSDVFKSLTSSRQKNVALITVGNHESCYDDPGWMSLLHFSALGRKFRWNLGAHDVINHTAIHSWFFLRGHVIPVYRGMGVYQPSVNYAIRQLNQGGWVNLFPEGKINMDKQNLRLKWGVGRMIQECTAKVMILPYWHAGMDDLLPNRWPYIPRFNKKPLILFGEPFCLDDLQKSMTSKGCSSLEIRKALTDVIQEELYSLKPLCQQQLQLYRSGNSPKS